MEATEAQQAQHAAKTKAKLEALERTLGISASAGEKREAEPDLLEIASKRHKFEDSAFLEESRELKEGVRNAVSAGEFWC
jgi:hypothetical protein